MTDRRTVTTGRGWHHPQQVGHGHGTRHRPGAEGGPGALRPVGTGAPRAGGQGSGPRPGPEARPQDGVATGAGAPRKSDRPTSHRSRGLVGSRSGAYPCERAATNLRWPLAWQGATGTPLFVRASPSAGRRRLPLTQAERGQPLRPKARRTGKSTPSTSCSWVFRSGGPLAVCKGATGTGFRRRWSGRSERPTSRSGWSSGYAVVVVGFLVLGGGPVGLVGGPGVFGGGGARWSARGGAVLLPRAAAPGPFPQEAAAAASSAQSAAMVWSKQAWQEVSPPCW